MSIRIHVQVAGTIKFQFPKPHFTLKLPDQATLGDLFLEIGSTMGEQLSKAIWNQDKNRFRGPVIVSSEGQVLKKEETVLRDNQLIELKRFLIGG